MEGGRESTTSWPTESPSVFHNFHVSAGLFLRTVATWDTNPNSTAGTKSILKEIQCTVVHIFSFCEVELNSVYHVPIAVSGFLEIVKLLQKPICPVVDDG